MCLTSVYSKFPKGWKRALYDKTCFHPNRPFFSPGTWATTGELFGRDVLCGYQPLDPQPIAYLLSLKRHFIIQDQAVAWGKVGHGLWQMSQQFGGLFTYNVEIHVEVPLTLVPLGWVLKPRDQVALLTIFIFFCYNQQLSSSGMDTCKISLLWCEKTILFLPVWCVLQHKGPWREVIQSLGLLWEGTPSKRGPSHTVVKYRRPFLDHPLPDLADLALL